MTNDKKLKLAIDCLDRIIVACERVDFKSDATSFTPPEVIGRIHGTAEYAMIVINPEWRS